MIGIWTRIGDLGEYEFFGNDLDALAERLAEERAGAVVAWRRGGLETDNYRGNNYASLYYGDADANFVRDVSMHERSALADLLGTVEYQR